MNIDGYADAASKGLKVGYIEGVSDAPAFWDAGLKLVPGPDDESNFKKLLDGDIDIYIAEKNIARAAIKKLGIKDKVAVIPKTLISKPYTMAFVKNSDIPDKDYWMRRFYEELDRLKANGQAKRLYIKYLY